MERRVIDLDLDEALRMVSCRESPSGTLRLAEMLGVTRGAVHQWKRAGAWPVYRQRQFLELMTREGRA